MLFSLCQPDRGGEIEESDYAMSDLCMLLDKYERIAALTSGRHDRILNHLADLIIEIGLPAGEEVKEPEILRG